MVAEKPILADSIAKVLSDGRSSHRKGWNGVCSVSEYTGLFKGKTAKFKVTSTCGHVMSLDFPSRFNNWNTVDPNELFACPTEKKEANPKHKMNQFLASEARDCDYLVLWLDCDKEGENICFEVIEAVQSSMRKPKTGNIMDVVFRARFSAVIERELKDAMQNLVKPNINESLSVDARQELDLRIGCAFTRFQTKYFQDKYGDLDSTLISFGPCQTPTLAFCVNRHDQIVQFKPEPYWLISCEIEVLKKPVKLEWKRERLFDKDVVQMYYLRLKDKEAAIVTDVVSKELTKDKPKALNTVELLRIASSAFGIGPAQTMSVAEHLYTRGFISYPRTETTSYPTGFNFNATLQQQTSNSRWGDVARQLLAEGISKPKGGQDVGDHPPITPMKGDDGQLSGDHLRLYEYITQHFIATVMKPCRYESITVRFLINNEEFTLQTRKVIDPGFTSVMSWQAIDDTEVPTSFSKGQSYPIREIKIVERETTPPGYLTESELITLMEKFQIGTDASIPVHINNISTRNYVKVESGRRLIPTKLGIALVRGYLRIDHELVEPTMRSEVEAQLTLIAKGVAEYKTVTNHALENFRRKFVYFVQNVGLVDSLFEDSFTPLADTGKPFSRCGKCRRFMKLVSARPQRLFCATCQETYSLPSGGKDITFRIHGENKCPLDDFDLIYLSAPGGKLARSYALCPYCFNNPPFPDMKEHSGCNACTHPSCPHSMITQGVAQCLNNCYNGQGVLVLDPQSGPKWRLVCNKCPSVVTLFEGASKLKIVDNECVNCGAKKVHADFKANVKELDDKNSYNGCVFCDQDKLGTLLNFNHAHLNVDALRNSMNRMNISRGRGRGRGGRGGRRGGRNPRASRGR
uniref:DNA topoisomerase n=1 Tax=Acrobeloides nanus TaxID=290746 RepID=A0A914CBZ5_9BILA